MSTIYRNARVVDPVNHIDCVKDVCVKDGLFANAEDLQGGDVEIRDVSGMVLCPGFTDVHVHLRDPGQTHKEDLLSGTRAAANGGFTSILAMPNTVPAMDRVERYLDLQKRAFESKVTVHVMQSVCMTLDRAGLVMGDLEALAAAGAPAFTDDGATTQNAGLMRQIMFEAARLDIPVIDHCEDKSLSAGGVMHEGEVSRKLGLKGQPRSAEELIVARDIMLAAETGCRIHLQHLSSAGSVEMLRRAIKLGIPVSGEATPHHLLLTDEAILKHGTNAKMAPPLREESDRLALIEALDDGTISCIATDHAPHTAEEKAAPWEKAPFGIVGIDVAVPLCLTELYHRGLISLEKLVAKFTAGPRDLLHRKIGAINVGEPADITFLDLNAEYAVDVNTFASRGHNCPYDGWHCKGRAFI